jgi:hypothetical protein
MDNTLNLGDMRKFKFQKALPVKAIQGSVHKSNESELEELKVLMDLRKTSTLFKTAARNKIENILKKLGAKSPEAWNK